MMKWGKAEKLLAAGGLAAGAALTALVTLIAWPGHPAAPHPGTVIAPAPLHPPVPSPSPPPAVTSRHRKRPPSEPPGLVSYTFPRPATPRPSARDRHSPGPLPSPHPSPHPTGLPSPSRSPSRSGVPPGCPGAIVSVQVLTISACVSSGGV